MPNILRNWVGNKIGNALTKPRRTEVSHLSADWLYHGYLQGFLTGMLTLGSRIASTGGCHPLITSHVKFKSYFVLAMRTAR